MYQSNFKEATQGIQVARLSQKRSRTGNGYHGPDNLSRFILLNIIDFNNNAAFPSSAP